MMAFMVAKSFHLKEGQTLDMLKDSPLAYDDEISQAEESGLSDGELYNLLRETGYFDNPLQ